MEKNAEAPESPTRCPDVPMYRKPLIYKRDKMDAYDGDEGGYKQHGIRSDSLFDLQLPITKTSTYSTRLVPHAIVLLWSDDLLVHVRMLRLMAAAASALGFPVGKPKTGDSSM